MVEWKKLGEVAHYYRGVTYNKKQEVSLNSGGTKIFRANNINLGTNSLNYDDIKEISNDVKVKDYQWLYKDDILICAGSGSKEHVGKVAYIKENLDYAYGGFMGKIVTDDSLSSRYLFHVISGLLFKKYLEVALNSTTINNLNSEIVNNFEIPIPSLSEQTRIVGILDTFTASVENLKQQIAERRKQYEYYRNQLLDLEGKEVIEMLSLGNDFQLKARIGWQGLTKKEYRTSGEYKLVTGTDFTMNLRINFGSCVYVDIERYEQDDYIKLKVGDVLITKDGTLGKVAYIDMLEIPATLNGGVFVVRELKNRVIPKFLMYYLTSNHFKKWMQQNHTTGSIQHLTQKLLSSFTIPVFTKSEQSRIVSILDTFEASIANLEAQLKEREKQYEYYRNKLLTFE